jgi:hypothetical protein
MRWFRDRTAADALARDHGISRATACRYLDEVVIVLAAQAPDLREALERAKDKGFSHLILDGKIIPCEPQQNRRHRPRGARPHAFRARLHHMNFVEITSLSGRSMQAIPPPAARRPALIALARKQIRNPKYQTWTATDMPNGHHATIHNGGDARVVHVEAESLTVTASRGGTAPTLRGCGEFGAGVSRRLRPADMSCER